MSDCQTKLNDVKKNCDDLYKSSCQDIKIEPEWGTCSYNGKMPSEKGILYPGILYSGSTRCYRGQLINTQYGLEICPSNTGYDDNDQAKYFNCTFVSDSEKTKNNIIIITIVIIVIIIILFLVYYYIKKKIKN